MTVYHEGEVRVQERAGVRSGSDRIARSVRDAIPPQAQAMLEDADLIVVSTTDSSGRPWASILTGSPGPVRVRDERNVELTAQPLPGDPLGSNLREGAWVGMMAIDLEDRRRMRLNGRLEAGATAVPTVRVHEVYSNCPKYIQRRSRLPDALPSAPPRATRSTTLDDSQRELIRGADTFFIATVHGDHGADASHRGGLPGFVEVQENTLTWPDYAGNAMFNTLGNLEAFPWAGLLFPDFGSGMTLQVVGRATIVWDEDQVAQRPGAERLVQLDVSEAVATANAFGTRYQLVEFSPFNPGRPQGAR